MEHSFTLATLFWLFVPMPLLIIFSLVSIFNQFSREKKEKNAPEHAHLNKKVVEKGGF